MPIQTNFVLRALLQHNYLPDQNKHHEELPPVFSSRSLSEKAALALRDLNERPAGGYDTVNYKLTRFNNIPRVLSIPHPRAYSKLALCITDNWGSLSHISSSPNSILNFREHKDGRLFVINYTGPVEQGLQEIELSFGKHFTAQTDIANFFPSIYSHAVPWAIMGKLKAKSKRKPQDHWSNLLDEEIRDCKRGETQGVAIGPVTSNIIAEILLSKVDDELTSRKYIFRRFNDDYAAYCDTEEEASNFILDLGKILAEYNLQLSSAKTAIEPLPKPIDAKWKTDLVMARPQGSSISGYQATRYLSMAVDYSKSFPQGSVLKYALKTLISCELTEEAQIGVLLYALNLSVYQPSLLPVIGELLERCARALQDIGELFKALLTHHTKLGRSDGVTWALYYCGKHSIPIESQVVTQVIEERDCLSLLALYRLGNPDIQNKLVSLAEEIASLDIYDRDQYWMLLYQLYRDGEIGNPYESEEAFEVMRLHGVTFLESSSSAPG